MGYRKIPTMYNLTFADEDYAGFEVRMKSIKIGRIRKLIRLMDEEVPGHDQMTEMFNLLLEGLVSWNLEDENGAPVPADLEGIEDQEFGMILMILETWLDGMTGISEDLGKDSSSGATSPVELPTMESL